MKKDNNLLLFGLLALGVYLVTRKKATPPPATTYTPPPATDTYLPTGEQTTTKPPATTRPPAKTYTPPPVSTTPPVVLDKWNATNNGPGGEGYAMNGYFPSKLTGGVIELPFGARWYRQEPTTTKNARMVL
jgi:hypothetical protein